jgi:hypothetical protein
LHGVRAQTLGLVARALSSPPRAPRAHAQSFETFQDLLRGATSYEDIDAKVAALASAGKLDPALLLTTSKMYMSVKESPYTSEEVKDIMAHLYWKASAGGPEGGLKAMPDGLTAIPDA